MKNVLFFVLFLLPVFANAEIIISEIAWMGTSTSANAEWIELSNTGGSSVNLAGWTLKANDGTPSINLSGSISSGAYALLERTNDNTVPSVQALVIYAGALGNTGEHLILRDGSGNIIQNLDFSSGWSAGNNNTKETMQWNGSIWITATGTPGAQNAVFDSGSTGNQGTGTGTQQEIEDEDDVSVLSSAPKEKNIRYEKELIEIEAHNKNIPVGNPVKFSLKTRDLDGSNILRGYFFWNMGDGTELTLEKNEKFEHVYEYEGSYVATVRYYSTYFEDVDPNATSRLTINVNSSGVVLSAIHPDGGIELRNTTGLEIDLSKWSLRDNFGGNFIIPNGTYILPGKVIVFSPKQTKLNPMTATLLNPSNKVVSLKEKFPSSVNSTNTKTSQTISSSNSNQVIQKDEKSEGAINLNEKLGASVNSSVKQKWQAIWPAIFVLLVVGVSALVYFLYRKEDKVTEDEFELID